MPTVAELSIEVNLKDTGTQAEILRLQQMLQRLASEDPDISVRVSAEAAKKEFDDLNERILLLDAQSVFIETDVDAKVALAQLEELQLAMRNLDRSTVNIDVDLDTQGALAHLAAMKVALKEIEKTKIDVDPDKKNVKTLNQISAAAQRASGTIRGITTAIIALGPALVPILGVALTAVLGLGAAFAAAGAGATLFGFVAVSAFAPIVDVMKKMKTAQNAYNQAVTDKQKETALAKLKALYESLDPAERAVVDGVNQLKDAWGKFVDQFRPELFQMAGEAMQALADALPHLAPLMQNATKAIHQLQTESIAAFQNPIWTEFFQNLTKYAEPSILGLGRSIGNLVSGFAAILNAFFPFSTSMIGGLENLTRKFRDWAASLEGSKGFNNFVAYIKENGPLVTGLLKSLANAFVAIVIAAAPIGEAVLKAVTALFNGIAKLQKMSSISLTALLVFAAVSAIFVNMIGPILAVINVVNLLVPLFAGLGAALETAGFYVLSFLGAWGLIIAAIALVIAAVVLAYQHFDNFRNSVDQLWQKLVQVGQSILNAVKPALQEVVQFFKDEWLKFIEWWNDNSETFAKAWENIKSWTSGGMSWVVDIISNALDVIIGIWNAVWPGLSTILGGVWTAIKGIISGAFQIIRGIFTVFAAIIAGDWGKIWDGLGDILFGAWSIIWGILKGAVQVVWGILQVLWGIVVAAWDLIAQAFVNGATNAVEFLKSVWSGIVSFFQFLWDGISGGAQNFVNVIVGFFQWLYDVLVGNSIIPDMVNAIISWWNILTGFLSAAMAPIVAVIVAAWNLIYTTVTTIVTAVVAVVTATWNALVSITTSVFNAIVSVVSTVMNTIATVIMTILNAISATWSAIWNAISTVAQAVWNVIKAFISAAIIAVQAVIAATMAIIQGNWSQAWNIISNAAQTIWNLIKSAITTAIQTISSTISSTLETIKSIWSSAWNTVWSAIKTAATNIMSTVTGLVGDILNAFTGLASKLYNAGKDMLTGLANGIKDAGSAAIGAAEDVIGKIAGLLPGSPAEWGPLSGRGYVKLRGQRFMEDLTNALNQTSGLTMSMQDIADIMALNANPTAAYDAITSSVAGAFQPTSAGSSSNVNVQAGAIVLQIGDNVDPAEARKAFEGSADTLGEALLTAIQKR